MSKVKSSIKPVYLILAAYVIGALLLFFAFNDSFVPGSSNVKKNFSEKTAEKICGVYNIKLGDGEYIESMMSNQKGRYRRYYVLHICGISDTEKFIKTYKKSNPPVQASQSYPQGQREMFFVSSKKPIVSADGWMESMSFTAHRYLGEGYGTYVFEDKDSVYISVSSPRGGGLQSFGAEATERYESEYYLPVRNLFDSL